MNKKINKKAQVVAAMLAKVVIGTLMVVALFIVFSIFSGPFLERMSDKENINSFAKFTNGLSTACGSGVSTQTYISLSETGSHKYIITVVGNETSTFLRTVDDDLVDKDSKRTVRKCTEDTCYCLLQIHNDDLKINNKQKAIVKEILEDTETVAYSKIKESSSYYSLESVYFSGTHGAPASGANYIGQMFTPTLTGLVSKIKIRGGIEDIDNSPPLNIISVDVWNTKNGKPSSNYKSVDYYVKDLKSSDDGWITLDFLEMYLEEGTEYALTISSSDDLSKNPFYWNGSETFSSKGAGDSLIDYTGASSVDGKKGWYTNENFNYDFKIIMDLNYVPIALYNRTSTGGYYVFNGKNNIAQPFIPVREGLVTSVSIQAKLLTPTVSFNTPIYLSIYGSQKNPDNAKNLPELIPDTHNLIAKERLPFDQLRAGADWIKIYFDDPFFVSKDETYFMSLLSEKDISSNPLRWTGVFDKTETNTISFGTEDAIIDKGTDLKIGEDGYWKTVSKTRYNFNMTGKNLDLEHLLDKWDLELKHALDPEIAYLKGVEVLQCRSLLVDLGCVGDDFKMLAPMIEDDNSEYVITWIQPNSRNLWFDSYSFTKPVTSVGAFENKILSHTEPELYNYLKIDTAEVAPIYD